MHLSLPSFPSTSNATAILLYCLTACLDVVIVTFPLFANLSAEITILYSSWISLATDHGFCMLFSTCRNTDDVWVFLVDQLAEISITSRNDRSIDAFSLFSAISHAAITDDTNSKSHINLLNNPYRLSSSSLACIVHDSI